MGVEFSRKGQNASCPDQTDHSHQFGSGVINKELCCLPSCHRGDGGAKK
jgi:hypothetical protein